MISLAGWKLVPWKTLGEMTPGFRMAIVGLSSPLMVPIIHLAAVIPASSLSTWG
jgi:hypothetical protein